MGDLVVRFSRPDFPRQRPLEESLRDFTRGSEGSLSLFLLPFHGAYSQNSVLAALPASKGGLSTGWAGGGNILPLHLPVDWLKLTLESTETIGKTWR